MFRPPEDGVLTSPHARLTSTDASTRTLCAYLHPLAAASRACARIAMAIGHRHTAHSAHICTLWQQPLERAHAPAQKFVALLRAPHRPRLILTTQHIQPALPQLSKRSLSIPPMIHPRAQQR